VTTTYSGHGEFGAALPGRLPLALGYGADIAIDSDSGRPTGAGLVRGLAGGGYGGYAGVGISVTRTYTTPTIRTMHKWLSDQFNRIGGPKPASRGARPIVFRNAPVVRLDP
jgi:hypothetical protein